MEQLGAIIRAQPSGGSNELALPGTRQLTRDSLLQLGTVLKQMSGAFPHQEYDVETTKIFLLTFEDLALEYSVTMLETSLRGFISRQKFFPHPSEVREVLEDMAKKAKAKKLQGLPKVGCEICGDGNGLVMGLDASGERFAKACECLKAYRRAKRAMEAKS